MGEEKKRKTFFTQRMFECMRTFFSHLPELELGTKISISFTESLNAFVVFFKCAKYFVYFYTQHFFVESYQYCPSNEQTRIFFSNFFFVYCVYDLQSTPESCTHICICIRFLKLIGPLLCVTAHTKNE